MTQQRTISASCPACFEESSFKIYSVIDRLESPALIESIFNRDIFKFTCPHCGEAILVAYDCTYTDSEKNFTVCLVSDAEGEVPSGITAEGHTLRIVRSINEFVEKIALIEDRIDDKVIELYKIMLEDQFQDEKPDSNIIGIYYGGRNFEDNTLMFFIITDNAENCRAFLSMSTYEAIENRFRDSAEKYSKISLVNKDWAVGVLQEDFREAE